ncbi:hypothetical protein [Actinomadura sp. 9N407]|uniref:hypothetical protein n=1 Tax=Actinomadura sp. 9N407 TaxID=3375154 RepID=UPI0037B15C9C
MAEAIARRMPERSLLGIVARTAHWLGWHHHFGPASGSDPKISDPLDRYAMAVCTGGVNSRPAPAAARTDNRGDHISMASPATIRKMNPVSERGR